METDTVYSTRIVRFSRFNENTRNCSVAATIRFIKPIILITISPSMDFNFFSDCKVWKHKRLDDQEDTLYRDNAISELRDGQDITSEGATVRLRSSFFQLSKTELFKLSDNR